MGKYFETLGALKRIHILWHNKDFTHFDLAKDAEIREYFESFGALERFNIQKNESGKSRGIGFLKYKSSKATKMALEVPHFIHHRPVVLRYTSFFFH